MFLFRHNWPAKIGKIFESRLFRPKKSVSDLRNSGGGPARREKARANDRHSLFEAPENLCGRTDGTPAPNEPSAVRDPPTRSRSSSYCRSRSRANLRPHRDAARRRRTTTPAIRRSTGVLSSSCQFFRFTIPIDENKRRGQITDILHRGLGLPCSKIKIKCPRRNTA